MKIPPYPALPDWFANPYRALPQWPKWVSLRTTDDYETIKAWGTKIDEIIVISFLEYVLEDSEYESEAHFYVGLMRWPHHNYPHINPHMYPDTPSNRIRAQRQAGWQRRHAEALLTEALL